MRTIPRRGAHADRPLIVTCDPLCSTTCCASRRRPVSSSRSRRTGRRPAGLVPAPVVLLGVDGCRSSSVRPPATPRGARPADRSGGAGPPGTRPPGWAPRRCRSCRRPRAWSSTGSPVPATGQSARTVAVDTGAGGAGASTLAAALAVSADASSPGVARDAGRPRPVRRWRRPPPRRGVPARAALAGARGHARSCRTRRAAHRPSVGRRRPVLSWDRGVVLPLPVEAVESVLAAAVVRATTWCCSTYRVSRTPARTRHWPPQTRCCSSSPPTSGPPPRLPGSPGGWPVASPTSGSWCGSRRPAGCPRAVARAVGLPLAGRVGVDPGWRPPSSAASRRAGPARAAGPALPDAARRPGRTPRARRVTPVDTALVARVTERLALAGERPTAAAVSQRSVRRARCSASSGVARAGRAGALELTGFGPLEALLRRPRGHRRPRQRAGRGVGRPGRGLARAPTSGSATRPPYAGWPSGSPPRPAAGWTTPRPTVDARLAGGVRLHAVLPPVSPAGTCCPAGAARRRASPWPSWSAARHARARRSPALLRATRRGPGLRSSSPAAPAPARRPCSSTPARPGRPGRAASSWSRTPASSRRDHPHVVRLEARPPNIEGAGGVDAARPGPPGAADAAGPARRRRGPRR